MKQYNNYDEALSYLYSFIPRKQSWFTGESGVKRTEYLLKLLGNPQEKINVIHIAGTSGKGSTAYLTSMLLKAHGFKVGLQVSPHLLDIRERFQIYSNKNNDSAKQILSHENLPVKTRALESEKFAFASSLISTQLFVKRLNKIIFAIEQAEETRWGRLSFFEICVCLAFYIFWKEKVDFAVMETGLGGLYDGTNVVDNPKKMVLLTRIGFDHQNILGHTLSAIASQKAGIIKKGNMAITVQQKQIVMDVFHSMVKKQKAALITIKKSDHFKNISVMKSGTTFDYQFKSLNLPRLKLGLIGEHQAENASIALTGLYELSRIYGFDLRKEKIYEITEKTLFKGRFEIRHSKKRDIIIDGAHNPQKMKAFISTLIKLYPQYKFDFLIAFSEGKNQITVMREMLRLIVPVANSINMTDFVLEGEDILHHSVPMTRIQPIFTQLGFKNYSFGRIDKNMMSRLMKINKRPLVITGSLYLIGSIYNTIDSLMNSR